MTLACRVGTRGSTLALWQANSVIGRLTLLAPPLRAALVTISTEGDRDQGTPLTELGGRGVFVREIEGRLLAGDIDLAVHSLKDQPTTATPGLSIAAILDRADPADAIFARSGGDLNSLPPGSRVGTSSSRRVGLLRSLRPDLEVVPLRGNVDTRLGRVESGELDAAVLALSGVTRLGRTDVPHQRLDPRVFVPAPGQGALALQCRSDDSALMATLGQLDDPAARAQTTAERACLGAFGGGCSVPVAAWAEPIEAGRLRLHVLAMHPDLGGTGWRTVVEGASSEPEALGREGADRVVDAAAGALDGLLGSGD